MPVTVSWYDEDQTVVWFSFVNSWKWEDYRNAVGLATALASTQPHQVNYIADFRQSGIIPRGALQEVKRQIPAHAANWGCTVIIQNSTYLRLIAGTFQRLYPGMAQNFAMVDSVEDALTEIERRQQPTTAARIQTEEPITCR